MLDSPAGNSFSRFYQISLPRRRKEASPGRYLKGSFGEDEEYLGVFFSIGGHSLLLKPTD